jgi:hypothetical protein
MLFDRMSAMLSNSSFWKLRKTPAGELLLDLDLRSFRRAQRSARVPFGQRFRLPRWLWTVAISGFGLGFGLSVGLFAPVPVLQADTPAPVVIAETNVKIVEVSVPWLEASLPVVESDNFMPRWSVAATAAAEVSYLSTGPGQRLVLSGNLRQPIFQELIDLKIGDEVVALGSHQGRYRYTVIETRLVPASRVESVIREVGEGLVLVGPENWTNGDEVIVVARPAL